MMSSSNNNNAVFDYPSAGTNQLRYCIRRLPSVLQVSQLSEKHVPVVPSSRRIHGKCYTCDKKKLFKLKSYRKIKRNYSRFVFDHRIEVKFDSLRIYSVSEVDNKHEGFDFSITKKIDAGYYIGTELIPKISFSECFDLSFDFGQSAYRALSVRFEPSIIENCFRIKKYECDYLAAQIDQIEFSYKTKFYKTEKNRTFHLDFSSDTPVFFYRENHLRLFGFKRDNLLHREFLWTDFKKINHEMKSVPSDYDHCFEYNSMNYSEDFSFDKDFKSADVNDDSILKKNHFFITCSTSKRISNTNCISISEYKDDDSNFLFSHRSYKVPKFKFFYFASFLHHCFNKRPIFNARIIDNNLSNKFQTASLVNLKCVSNSLSRLFSFRSKTPKTAFLNKGIDFLVFQGNQPISLFYNSYETVKALFPKLRFAEKRFYMPFREFELQKVFHTNYFIEKQTLNYLKTRSHAVYTHRQIKKVFEGTKDPDRSLKLSYSNCNFAKQGLDETVALKGAAKPHLLECISQKSALSLTTKISTIAGKVFDFLMYISALDFTNIVLPERLRRIKKPSEDFYSGFRKTSFSRRCSNFLEYYSFEDHKPTSYRNRVDNRRRKIKAAQVFNSIYGLADRQLCLKSNFFSVRSFYHSPALFFYKSLDYAKTIEFRVREKVFSKFIISFSIIDFKRPVDISAPAVIPPPPWHNSCKNSNFKIKLMPFHFGFSGLKYKDISLKSLCTEAVLKLISDFGLYDTDIEYRYHIRVPYKHPLSQKDPKQWVYAVGMKSQAFETDFLHPFYDSDTDMKQPDRIACFLQKFNTNKKIVAKHKNSFAKIDLLLQCLPFCHDFQFAIFADKMQQHVSRVIYLDRKLGLNLRRPTSIRTTAPINLSERRMIKKTIAFDLCKKIINEAFSECSCHFRALEFAKVVFENSFNDFLNMISLHKYNWDSDPCIMPFRPGSNYLVANKETFFYMENSLTKFDSVFEEDLRFIKLVTSEYLRNSSGKANFGLEQVCKGQYDNIMLFCNSLFESNKYHCPKLNDFVCLNSLNKDFCTYIENVNQQVVLQSEFIKSENKSSKLEVIGHAVRRYSVKRFVTLKIKKPEINKCSYSVRTIKLKTDYKHLGSKLEFSQLDKPLKRINAFVVSSKLSRFKNLADSRKQKLMIQSPLRPSFKVYHIEIPCIKNSFSVKAVKLVINDYLLNSKLKGLFKHYQDSFEFRDSCSLNIDVSKTKINFEVANILDNAFIHSDCNFASMRKTFAGVDYSSLSYSVDKQADFKHPGTPDWYDIETKKTSFDIGFVSQ